MPRFLVEADIALVRVVAAFPIVEAGVGPVFGFFGLNSKRGASTCSIKEARRNGLQRASLTASVTALGGVRLGDQVGEARTGLARRVAGGPADDLHDLGQARPISDVGACSHRIQDALRHAEGDDDVHVIGCSSARGLSARGNAVPLAGLSSTRSAIRRTRPSSVLTRWNRSWGRPCHCPDSSMMCSTSLILSFVLSRALTLGMWTIVFSAGSSTFRMSST